jgi:hypothetical protein
MPLSPPQRLMTGIYVPLFFFAQVSRDTRLLSGHSLVVLTGVSSCVSSCSLWAWTACGGWFDRRSLLRTRASRRAKV